jgi:hypothetical protein
MEVIYKFNLNEDGERESLEVFQKAQRFYFALLSIQERIRGYRKYSEETEEDKDMLILRINEELAELSLHELP